jgi:DNA-binding NarL/FixJ family response regulator
MRILILDDDPFRRSELAALAARACPQAEVCRASNGDPPADEPAPAVVLLHVRGDDPTGCATVAALRARWPEARLLVVSAQDAAAPAVAALQAGASHYLVLRDGGDPSELRDAMSHVARPARRAGAAAVRGSTESPHRTHRVERRHAAGPRAGPHGGAHRRARPDRGGDGHGQGGRGSCRAHARAARVGDRSSR